MPDAAKVACWLSCDAAKPDRVYRWDGRPKPGQDIGGGKLGWMSSEGWATDISRDECEMEYGACPAVGEVIEILYSVGERIKEDD